MTTHITVEEFRKLAKKPAKYRSKITVVDGIKFRSKKEANFYCELKLAREAGTVRYFLRQVPFHLPGNTKYLADFLVAWKDGTIWFVDTKGYRTATYKRNKKQVEALYPIRIQEI